MAYMYMYSYAVVLARYISFLNYEWHFYSITTTTHSPWSGVPVGVIISLLGTLVATPSSSVVLPGVDGRFSLEVTVSGVETHVAFPESAVEVVVVVFVHAVLEIGVAVTVVTLVLVLWDSAGCESE